MIEISNLSFSYSGNKILDSLSLKMPLNHILCILGANGSGKTTLLKCILGLLHYKNGKIRIGEVDISSKSSHEIAKFISYVPQLSSVKTDFLVEDYIVLGRTPYLNVFQQPLKSDYEIAHKIAEQCGIKHLLNSNIMNLSGGELQMVSIAKAMVQNTQVIIMDEPTSALDIKNQMKVISLIQSLKNDNKTIIMTTHDPNHALIIGEYSAFLLNGKLKLFGLTTDIFDNEILQKVYGKSIRLTKTYDTKEQIICFNFP